MARKAVLVTLSDGREVTVKEPGSTEFGMYMRMLPGLMAMGKLAEAVTQGEQLGVQTPLPNVSDEQMAEVYKLLAHAIGISDEEFANDLTMSDTLGLIMAVSEVMAGQNFTKPTSLPSTVTPQA